MAQSVPHLSLNRVDHNVFSEAKVLHFLHTSTSKFPVVNRRKKNSAVAET